MHRLVCSLLPALVLVGIVAVPIPTFAQCPMASRDGRYVLAQDAVESLGGQWITRREIVDTSKVGEGKAAVLYTAEDTTSERPDLDYVPRSLRETLQKFGIAPVCLPAVTAAKAGVEVRRKGCSAFVKVKAGKERKLTFAFGEAAVHGEDPCQADFRFAWYPLHGGGLLVEVEALSGDDPAMGQMTLGRAHAIIPGK